MSHIPTKSPRRETNIQVNGTKNKMNTVPAAEIMTPVFVHDRLESPGTRSGLASPNQQIKGSIMANTARTAAKGTGHESRRGRALMADAFILHRGQAG